jgi:phosphoribosylformylglycinamidine cyclo-ligase
MSEQGNSKYAQDGVDQVEGNSYSEYAAGICRSTYGVSPFVKVKDFSSGMFRGPRATRYVRAPRNSYQVAAPDGIGTKTVLIDSIGNQFAAAHDIIAMTGGDITRYGGKPTIFINVLDVKTLGEKGSEANKLAYELVHGLGVIARNQQLVLQCGETAQLGACVGTDNPDAKCPFNWAGAMLGIVNEKMLITGNELKAGQAVMALREYGFRSNGISSVRKAFELRFGEGWYTNPSTQELLGEAARPSLLYDKFLADMNGWRSKDFLPEIKMYAIAHITGGGIPDKFGSILFPRGLGADLNYLWDPPEIMAKCREWREMPEFEAYQTWNCGQGALVVIDLTNAKEFVGLAKPYGIEARMCGMITEGRAPRIEIRSMFSDPRKVLIYDEINAV